MRLLILSAFALLLLTGDVVVAQPLIPDPSYGQNGVVSGLYAGAEYSLRASAVDRSGRLVYAGDQRKRYDVFSVVGRVTAEGTRDESFGTGGFSFSGYGNEQEPVYVSSVGLDHENRIYVAGTFLESASFERIVISRFTERGRRDSTYANGVVVLPRLSSSSARGLVVRPDGSAALAFCTDRGRQCGVLLLSEDGTLDTRFGESGVVFLGPLVPPNDTWDIQTLAVDPAGRFVLAGNVRSDVDDWDLFVARFTPQGRRDSTFNPPGEGFVQVDFERLGNGLTSVSAFSDSGLILAGTTVKGSVPGSLFVRLDADGHRLDSFGEHGLVWHPYPPDPYQPLYGTDAVAQRNGSTVFALRSSRPIVGRLLPSGLMDPSVAPGGSGFATLPIPAFNSFLLNLSLDDQGDAYLCGSRYWSERPGEVQAFGVRFALNSQTAVEESASSDVQIETYPNPLARNARVTLRLGAPANASVRIVDALGRTVAVLADGPLAAGPHTLALDAAALPPGVYVVVATVGAERSVRRVTVVR